MTTTSQSESAAKKDVTKLQRAIVDGLEDVKAQDIQVFNTEHLSPLFERVIVASGTSNRQTKALAASVRDAVREAGFPKPRTEGEENGEWIIVDCGAAVVHVMQPTIRQYYRLEELWGDTPVRLKLGAPKPAAAPAAKVPAKTAARRAAKAEAEAAAVPAKSAKATAAARKRSDAATQEAAPVAKKPAARKSAGAAVTSATKAPAKKAPAKKTAAASSAAKAPAKTAATTATKTAVKTPAKTAAKAPAKTAPAKTAIQTLVVKPRAEKAPAKKAAPPCQRQSACQVRCQSCGQCARRRRTRQDRRAQERSAAQTQSLTFEGLEPCVC